MTIVRCINSEGVEDVLDSNELYLREGQSTTFSKVDDTYTTVYRIFDLSGRYLGDFLQKRFEVYLGDSSRCAP